MMLSLHFVLLVLSSCTLILGKTSTYHLVTVDANNRIPLDIVHNEEANTVLITVGDVSKYEKIRPSINFHDFDSGYTTFKLVAEKACLLTKSVHEYPTVDIYKSGHTIVYNRFHAKVNTTAISNVASIAGQRTADFCSDYNTFWMTLKRINNKRGSVGNTDYAAADYISAYCSGCLFQMQQSVGVTDKYPLSIFNQTGEAMVDTKTDFEELIG